LFSHQRSGPSGEVWRSIRCCWEPDGRSPMFVSVILRFSPQAQVDFDSLGISRHTKDPMLLTQSRSCGRWQGIPADAAVSKAPEWRGEDPEVTGMHRTGCDLRRILARDVPGLATLGPSGEPQPGAWTNRRKWACIPQPKSAPGYLRNPAIPCIKRTVCTFTDEWRLLWKIASDWAYPFDTS
jgi:hypothetical protein